MCKSPIFSILGSWLFEIRLHLFVFSFISLFKNQGFLLFSLISCNICYVISNHKWCVSISITSKICVFYIKNMSHINILKKSDPSIEPSGTLESIASQELFIVIISATFKSILSQSRYPLDPKNFLRGLHPLIHMKISRLLSCDF